MTEIFVFCDNDSGSKEHLWPKCIYNRKEFGPLGSSIPFHKIRAPYVTWHFQCGNFEEVVQSRRKLRGYKAARRSAASLRAVFLRLKTLCTTSTSLHGGMEIQVVGGGVGQNWAEPCVGVGTRFPPRPPQARYRLSASAR
jgi:hypothetical protein